MNIPISVKMAVWFDWIQIVGMLGFFTRTIAYGTMKHDYGKFYWVLLFFMFVSGVCSTKNISNCKNMKGNSVAISTIKFREADNIHDGGQNARFNQEFSTEFKRAYGILSFTKCMMTLAYFATFFVADNLIL